MRKARKITIPIPGTLDWELLRRFNIITHSQTFGEAAEKIGTSQPALLKQMDDLEEFLGKKLFMMTAKYRSMELTPDGKTLQTLTDQAVEIFSKQITRSVKKATEKEKKKLIKIITTAGTSTTLLPNWISEFLNIHDDVRIELSAQTSPQKINVGEIIIRHDFLPQTNIKTVFLNKLFLYFYASRDYIKKYGIPASDDDLIYHKMLSSNYFNLTSASIYTLSRDNIIHLEPIVQSDYIEFLVQMAFRNQGIMELPEIHPATKVLEKIPTLPARSVEVFMRFLDVSEQEPIVFEFIRFVENKIENKI